MSARHTHIDKPQQKTHIMANKNMFPNIKIFEKTFVTNNSSIVFKTLLKHPYIVSTN